MTDATIETIETTEASEPTQTTAATQTSGELAAPKRFQCRHILTDGHRCGSPCLRQEDFCYYHHTTRRPAPPAGQILPSCQTFDLPIPDDRAAIQLSIGEVLRRIAAGEIDPRRAGLLLYGLQIASMNLPRPARATVAPPTGAPVEELTLHPEHGPLAPEAELLPPPHIKTLVEIMDEKWIEEGWDDLQPLEAPWDRLPRVQASAPAPRLLHGKPKSGSNCRLLNTLQKKYGGGGAPGCARPSGRPARTPGPIRSWQGPADGSPATA